MYSTRIYFIAITRRSNIMTVDCKVRQKQPNSLDILLKLPKDLHCNQLLITIDKNGNGTIKIEDSSLLKIKRAIFLLSDSFFFDNIKYS